MTHKNNHELASDLVEIKLEAVPKLKQEQNNYRYEG